MAYLQKAQGTRRVIQVSKRSLPIDLTGTAIRQFMYTAENDVAVRLIRIIYEEATSSHTGVDLKIGKIGFPDYFALFTSEISKASGDVTEIEKIDNREFLSAGETLTIDCDGFKAGTGIVGIQIELEGYR